MTERDQTLTAAADAALAEMHTRFDEEAGLLRDTAGTIGYHTRIQPGTTVHPTSNSLDYAVRLARTGDPRWHPRIVRIVRTLLPWQETNPVAATYGIWPWYVEEPLDKMSPPDWNWADFCGGNLLELLNVAPDCLPADLVASVEAAVGHAAWSIFRRNVGPEYTNIAISGAAVTLGAGARRTNRQPCCVSAVCLTAAIWLPASHGATRMSTAPWSASGFPPTEAFTILTSTSRRMACSAVMTCACAGSSTEAAPPSTPRVREPGTWSADRSAPACASPRVRIGMAARSSSRRRPKETRRAWIPCWQGAAAPLCRSGRR